VAADVDVMWIQPVDVHWLDRCAVTVWNLLSGSAFPVMLVRPAIGQQGKSAATFVLPRTRVRRPPWRRRIRCPIMRSTFGRVAA
jgi:hypothetical protein